MFTLVGNLERIEMSVQVAIYNKKCKILTESSSTKCIEKGKVTGILLTSHI